MIAKKVAIAPVRFAQGLVWTMISTPLPTSNLDDLPLVFVLHFHIC